MLNWRPGSRQRQPRSWSRFGAAAVSGVALIGVLLIIASHRNAQFPTVKSCPSAAVVNEVLGTHVARPTAASEADLLGCFYQQGSDTQAVSVSFASRAGTDPCRKRPPIDVSGHEGCDVSGSRGTSAGGASLLVETKSLQIQFSSSRRDVPLAGLERLATKALAESPPHLEASLSAGVPVEGRRRGKG
jgi:hypothetical protein